jgi:hypothetical protein
MVSVAELLMDVAAELGNNNVNLAADEVTVSPPQSQTYTE